MEQHFIISLGAENLPNNDEGFIDCSCRLFKEVIIGIIRVVN
jgi:hypothetical protein